LRLRSSSTFGNRSPASDSSSPTSRQRVGRWCGSTTNAARDDAPGPPATDAAAREYHAMRGRKANRAAYRLIIPNQGPDDRFLPFTRLTLIDASKDGGQIIMEFSGCSVLLDGRNLRPVANAIATYCCGSVEAFDASRRDQPTDPEAPFIKSVRFHYASTEPPARAVERSAERTH
jgi:hypothetical protein